MDKATIGGLILGFSMLLTAYVLDGGHITALMVPTAFMIVMGGTAGAVMVSYSMDELKAIPKLVRIAFFEKQDDPSAYIQTLITYADKARREGLLALEQDIDKVDDPFMQQGIQLVVDGTDPELTRNILETEIYAIENRHRLGASIFEAAGGFSPTMGILGTVMGLVHVLGNLSNPDSLGPAIAVAFNATLYGVGIANLVFLPIANKLKGKSKKELTMKELVLEGILSIQAGESPTILKEKLKAFLDPKTGEAVLQARVGETVNG